MKIFESHAHYDDSCFKDDFDAVMKKIKSAGVEKVMLAGTTVEASRKMAEMARENPLFISSAGIHPEECETAEISALSEIREIARNPEVHAIGEIGLDYHMENCKRDKQKEFFIRQLDIADELSLPVIIHSRDAAEDTVNILKSRKIHRGVIHCFSGSRETMREMLNMGYYIGFTGVVTFKNARTAAENALLVPKDRFLVETDSPYMAPVPHRGERNDSSNLVYIIEKIASIKGLTPDEVALLSYNNAERLFERK